MAVWKVWPPKTQPSEFGGRACLTALNGGALANFVVKLRCLRMMALTGGRGERGEFGK